MVQVHVGGYHVSNLLNTNGLGRQQCLQRRHAVNGTGFYHRIFITGTQQIKTSDTRLHIVRIDAGNAESQIFGGR